MKKSITNVREDARPTKKDYKDTASLFADFGIVVPEIPEFDATWKLIRWRTGVIQEGLGARR